MKSLVVFPQALAMLDQKLDCEAAAQALVDALRSGEGKAMLAVLGQAGDPVVLSGDPVSDRRARERFVAAYDDQHRLEAGGGKVVLVVGRQDFPFPIPIVPDGRLALNTAAGREEIVNRRIGQNELNTIQVCLAYVYWPTNPGEPPSPLGPFIVNQDGVGYQKNLGPNSAATARAMKVNSIRTARGRRSECR